MGPSILHWPATAPLRQLTVAMPKNMCFESANQVYSVATTLYSAPRSLVEQRFSHVVFRYLLNDRKDRESLQDYRDHLSADNT